MEITIVSLFFFHILHQASCQYSCSITPDGQCKSCDCVPDCFDLSDEINCHNNTSIHDVLLRQSPNREQKPEIAEKFFPPPPLPPFPLCPEITTMTFTPPTRLPLPTVTRQPPTQSPSPTTVTRQPPTQSPSPTTVTRQTTQVPSTLSPESTTAIWRPTRFPPTVFPPFPTAWPTQAPRTTEKPTTTTKIATQSPWMCSFMLREYYRRCMYLRRINNYCIYVTRALQVCRSNAVPMTTPTTTTTTTTFRPIYVPTRASSFDYRFPSFDYYGTNYNNNYDYNYYG